MQESDEGNGKGGIIFYISIVLLAAIGLLLMALQGRTQDNINMIVIALIFFSMLVFSFVVARKSLLNDQHSFTQVSGFFWLGFIVWGLISYFGSKKPQSIFSAFAIPEQGLLATVNSQLSPINNWFVTNISAPITEEIFFLLALPILLFSMLKNIIPGDEWHHKLARLAIVVIVDSLLFALFHTGQVLFTLTGLTAFAIAAISFRAIQLTAKWGEDMFDLIKNTDILASAAIGSHFGNNFFSSGGLSTVFSLLIYEPLGWVLIVILALSLIVPLYHLKNKLRR